MGLPGPLVFLLLSTCINAIEIKLHTGIHKRQTQELTEENVLDYLVQFNHLRQEERNDPESVKEAKRRFQNFAGIAITGTSSEETKEKMKLKRCGCPDVDRPMINLLRPARTKREMRRFQPQPFRTRNRRWRRTTLTWRVTQFTRQLRRDVVRSELRRAFDVWAKVSPLTFIEVQDNRPVDILISFENGDHGDGSPFDGPSRVLAHAFFPEDGTTHFDDAETWVTNSSRGIDFFTVAAHEFGHALGLSHSEVNTALMAPFYAGFKPNFQLDRDDVAGIQSLYGRRENPPTRPPPTRRPRVTTAAPIPTDPPGVVPPFCRLTFRAAMEDDNGFLLLFRRSSFHVSSSDPRVNVQRARYTRGIFPFAPRNPDAVFNTINGTYFIRRRLVFKYSRFARRQRRLTNVDYGLNVPELIRGAVAFGENLVFLIGSRNVWVYNTRDYEVVEGSQAPIQEIFPGIPNVPYDAVFTLDNNIVHFLMGTNVVSFDRNTGEVTPPRNFGMEFFPEICARR